jgi:hypothetical protein
LHTFIVSILAVGFLGGMVSPALGQTSCMEFEACVKDLKSSDAAIQSAAIFMLGSLKDRRAIPHLLEIVREQKDRERRVSALRALGHFKDPSIIESLLPIYRDRDPYVAVDAVRVTARLGGKPAVQAMIRALKMDEEVQVAALEGLSQMADIEAKAALLEVYRKSGDPRIRGMAVIALQRIWAVWGPTEEEMDLPLYPGAEFIPNARAEWIFTTKDSLDRVAQFYKQKLKGPAMSFPEFRKKYEGGLSETKDGQPTPLPGSIFVVEEQTFNKRQYPSKMIFLVSRGKETEIQIHRSLGED